MDARRMAVGQRLVPSDAVERFPFLHLYFRHYNYAMDRITVALFQYAIGELNTFYT
jgi:hypothetical protein